MSFLYPSLLFLLILPLLLGVAAIIHNSRRQSTWRKLVSEQHEKELVRRRPSWKTTIPALLILMASFLAIIALARPINGFEESEESSSSRNLIIALDISRSMETQDVRPSRLEEARAAAYELINALPSDKIGLIVFSGEADLVVPLTYDHDALKEILSNVKRDWIPTGGTNFGMVLEKATQDLQRSAPTGSNALIIFSDGEDTVGEDSKELAKQAKKNNLLVITVGIGTEAGGAIPDPNGDNGLYQGSDGKHVISNLKIPQLQEFANATGGDFFIMGAGADLTEFALRAAEKIDRHDDTSSINKVPRDLFTTFLIPALLLMLLGLILSTDWKNVGLRRFHSAPLLLLAFLLMGQQLHAEEQPTKARIQDVVHDLQQQNYSSALARMELIKQQSEGGQLGAQLSFAQGIAAMQQSDEATARDAFSRALLSEDKELQAAASYQLSKMGSELHFDELRKMYEDEQGQAKQPSSKELEALRPKFAQDLKNFEDTLSLQDDMEQAQQAAKGMKTFLTALDEEIKKLQEQEQQQQNQDQNQDQQNQDKSDEQDEQKDKEQNQDKSDQSDEQKDEQKDEEQDQDKSDQSDDNKDEQQDQDKSDQSDEQKDEQDSQEDKQEEQQSPEEQQQEEEQATQTPEPKSQEEKDRDRARSILNMNLDEEKGSPVPRINSNVRPPAKDY